MVPRLFNERTFLRLKLVQFNLIFNVNVFVFFVIGLFVL